MNVGDILKADVFAVGDRIDVVGTSKGKGYAGAIKRWNQHRLRESHGTGPVARHAGSNGLLLHAVPRVQGQNACRAIWAPSALPSRTSRSSRLTQKII